jgi:serine/threonine-protein kinase RsbW
MALTLRIAGCLEDVALLAAAVEAVAVELGLTEGGAAAVQLSTVEAVNNVILHAAAGSGEQPVELTLYRDGERLTIEVSDGGRAIPAALLAAAARRALDPADEEQAGAMADSGRGLVIIHRLMNEVRYATREGRNTLSMTVRIVK